MIRQTFLLAVALLLGSGSAVAQTVPFGKNKIQYHDFDWRVLSGEHVDVYYYPEEDTLARLTLAYAEESFAFLERKFQHHPFRRIPLIVYSSSHHFEQTNVFPGFIPEGVLGFTEYMKRRVALPFRGDYAQFRHTLRHELVHAFQLSKLAEVQARHPRQRRASPQAIHWFTEGLAEFWSSEQTPEDEMFIRDLVLTGRLPNIRDFSYQYSYSSYPLGAELHKYLTRRFGEQYIVQVYEQYWKFESFEKTLAAVLDVDLDQLSREWKYELEQRFFPTYAERPPFEVSAQVLVAEGRANFKPVIYEPPSGPPQLLFLSPRSGYTNIYRTDLEQGESSVQVVVEGERSAEFESFHANESRIDVNSEGVIAFVSRYLERDALFLWDLNKRRTVGRYQWPDLVGLKSPAWNATGTRVVFEGLTTSGLSDLYTIDFATQQRKALTQDRYRDEDPAWSPDGRSVVFASDRTVFGAEGNTNLFLIDVESGDIRYLTYGAWNDQDPRWAKDGSTVVFSSNRSGTYDLYTVDPSGEGRRITRMTGGAFDPAWLPDGEGVVFAGFREGQFRIYKYLFPTGDEEDELEPVFALPSPPAVQVALGSQPSVGDGRLPMGWEWKELEAPLLADARSERYNTWREVTIDFAGGDALVAPGLGSAQGAQFLATDMLGDHIIFAGLSATQVDDLSHLVDSFSAHLLYLNLSRRLNYGAGLFRFKGLYRDVAFDVYEEETYGGYFIASYPLSKFQRIELNLGIERSDRLDFEDAFETIGNPDTREDTRDLTREGYLASNYLSYVKDNTLWLPTGPIDGERYNLSLGLVSCFVCESPSPVTGAPVKRTATAENYVVSADYRRYFRTSLLTAYAIRGYGFFSDGAIPARAVLGGSHRLRGYPRFSLTGSRLWLVNQEWRFPILHGLSLAFPFGELRFPGIQGALFGDIGSSWLEGQKPDGSWGSYGLGLRTSLGPPLVLRMDIGRRFRIGEKPPVVFDDGESFGDTFIDFFFGFNY